MVVNVTDPTEPAKSGATDSAAMEDYIGRCRAVIIELTGELPAEGFDDVVFGNSRNILNAVAVRRLPAQP